MGIGQLIEDLLSSPSWVLVTFSIVYSLFLMLVTWKISSWYRSISGWKKQRTDEKNWKKLVEKLEKENIVLQNKIDELNQDNSTVKKKSIESK